ncbi:MAG: hypothetical protein HGA67_02975 [Candidatus Yonathbacteria bacterium]|nr:hypothetical protein [Candidatus Yonathbacteria bacterium]
MSSTTRRILCVDYNTIVVEEFSLSGLESAASEQEKIRKHLALLSYDAYDGQNDHNVHEHKTVHIIDYANKKKQKWDENGILKELLCFARMFPDASCFIVLRCTEKQSLFGKKITRSFERTGGYNLTNSPQYSVTGTF